ncbi:MAG TPA: hypothetical protein VLG15_09675, partial [Thermoanaerobaculia bacterium]|nr:hypothetical protein [Thermoanaerobaculia bacterium]
MRTARLLRCLPAAVYVLAAACATPGTAPPATDTLSVMNDIAPAYVKLVLAVGRYDKDYVDAFYGPAEWKTEVEAAKKPLDAIAPEADALVARLSALPEPGDEMLRLRSNYLTRQLQALTARVAILRGKKMSFDEESRALYDAVAPTRTEDHFRAIRDELDSVLPGAGGAASLVERYEAWRKDFTIPKEKVDPVFRAAIAECRDRTAAHMALPPGESFTVEYVTGKSWSGYNWYQGGYKSLIQVNTDFPITIDRAIDLACHEGYPGHHVYNTLLEKSLVRDRGWVEYSVYPLFSPQSLIAEGSANFGIEMAFPGGARVEYEKRALYPLAGLDPARAEEFDRVRRIVDRLAYAGNEAARRYLNGEIDGVEAAKWLSEYALYPADRAAQRVRFFDQYRSYVINYNLGKDLVRQYVESNGGTPDDPRKR